MWAMVKHLIAKILTSGTFSLSHIPDTVPKRRQSTEHRHKTKKMTSHQRQESHLSVHHSFFIQQLLVHIKSQALF